MGGFMDKAKDFADQHDEQVDQGLDKAGDVADQRTGGGHSEQIDRGVDIAQERTGEGDTQPTPTDDIRQAAAALAGRLHRTVGGGGLVSGVALAVNLDPGIKVIGVEPETADVVSRSLEAGSRKLPTAKRLTANAHEVGMIRWEAFARGRHGGW